MVRWEERVTQPPVPTSTSTPNTTPHQPHPFQSQQLTRQRTPSHRQSANQSKMRTAGGGATRTRCVRCARGKKGCSGDRPTCELCRRRGYECEYDDNVEGQVRKPRKVGGKGGTSHPSTPLTDRSPSAGSDSAQTPNRRESGYEGQTGTANVSEGVLGNGDTTTGDDDGDIVMKDVEMNTGLKGSKYQEDTDTSRAGSPVTGSTYGTRSRAKGVLKAKGPPNEKATVPPAAYKQGHQRILEQEAARELEVAKKITTEESEAEAMSAIRRNLPLDHDFRALDFQDIDISHLSLTARSEWQSIAKDLYASMNFDDGLEIDVDGSRRKHLRRLVVEMRKFQLKGKEDPNFVLALGKLIGCARLAHDFYDMMGAMDLTTRRLKVKVDDVQDQES